MPVHNATPTATKSAKPDIPSDVQAGDFIVGRYAKSEWSRFFPWEEWDHAALITRVDPLTVIEASGIILQRKASGGKEEIREGVVEYEFQKPRTITNMNGTENADGNLGLKDDLKAMLWLRPVFPNPLRETDHWLIPWRQRKIIRESEARKRTIQYARSQVGDPFKLSLLANTRFSASKKDENEWYCSLLIFKSYSRTITNMFLESYEPHTGFFVTSEDLVQSKRSCIYHSWSRKS